MPCIVKLTPNISDITKPADAAYRGGADAVSLIRRPVLDSLVGLGTGKLREHFDILVEAKVPIYVSAISCEIRGVTELDLENTNSIKVFPKTLLNLSLQADRTFVY